MNEAPIVKAMLLCDDVRPNEANPNRHDIVGLMTRLWSDTGAFPMICRQLCVYVIVTNGRGRGTGLVACVHEETGLTIWRTVSRELRFGNDPLAIQGDYYRMRDVIFPVPGVYNFEYRYNGIVLATQSLVVKGRRP
jgi:hypothetical protein